MGGSHQQLIHGRLSRLLCGMDCAALFAAWLWRLFCWVDSRNGFEAASLLKAGVAFFSLAHSRVAEWVLCRHVSICFGRRTVLSAAAARLAEDKRKRTELGTFCHAGTLLFVLLHYYSFNMSCTSTVAEAAWGLGVQAFSVCVCVLGGGSSGASLLACS